LSTQAQRSTWTLCGRLPGARRATSGPAAGTGALPNTLSSPATKQQQQKHQQEQQRRQQQQQQKQFTALQCAQTHSEFSDVYFHS